MFFIISSFIRSKSNAVCFTIISNIDLSDRLRYGITKDMLMWAFVVGNFNRIEHVSYIGAWMWCVWNLIIIDALQHAAVASCHRWHRFTVVCFYWYFCCFSSKLKFDLAKIQMTKQQSNNELFILQLALVFVACV